MILDEQTTSAFLENNKSCETGSKNISVQMLNDVVI